MKNIIDAIISYVLLVINFLFRRKRKEAIESSNEVETEENNKPIDVTPSEPENKEETIIDEPQKEENEPEYLKEFRGDISWIHAREGHAGHPYWPGGKSGVTLDPGFDLGYNTKEKLDQFYAGIIGQKKRNSLAQCIGLKGDDAKAFIDNNKDLINSIKITRKQAEKVFPYIADPYWEKITERFPELLDDSCPSSVQTALLSLAYNRGPRNRHLEILKEPISKHDWLEVANKIGSMQQKHKIEGIRKRRKMEAKLIVDELKEQNNGEDNV